MYVELGIVINNASINVTVNALCVNYVAVTFAMKLKIVSFLTFFSVLSLIAANWKKNRCFISARYRSIHLRPVAACCHGTLCEAHLAYADSSNIRCKNGFPVVHLDLKEQTPHVSVNHQHVAMLRVSLEHTVADHSWVGGQHITCTLQTRLLICWSIYSISWTIAVMDISFLNGSFRSD